MAITWENKGSYQDLSRLADDSMWPSSQAAGNMTSSSREAMTAPGSSPVDPVPDRNQQGDPTIRLGAEMPTGTSGKPQASGQVSAARAPRRAGWGAVTVPQVVRSKPVNVPTAEVKP